MTRAKTPLAETFRISRDVSVTAQEERLRSGHPAIDVDHLFLALLVVGGPAAALLTEHGISLQRAREAVAAVHRAQVASLGITVPPTPPRRMQPDSEGVEFTDRALTVMQRTDPVSYQLEILVALLDEPSGHLDQAGRAGGVRVRPAYGRAGPSRPSRKCSSCCVGGGEQVAGGQLHGVRPCAARGGVRTVVRPAPSKRVKPAAPWPCRGRPGRRGYHLLPTGPARHRPEAPAELAAVRPHGGGGGAGPADGLVDGPDRSWSPTGSVPFVGRAGPRGGRHSAGLAMRVPGVAAVSPGPVVLALGRTAAPHQPECRGLTDAEMRGVRPVARHPSQTRWVSDRGAGSGAG